MSKTFKEPAFPVPGLQHDEDFNGMTLRDYFAAKALQGFCANSHHSVLDGADFFSDAAREAYQLADAMLAAREQ
ncbi:MAG: hypothetical protein AAFO57_00275 [Pseudomonadota bacterium]